MGNNYESMKLEGATAAVAVDCMRMEGVIPSAPRDPKGQPHYEVEMDKSGEIRVDEIRADELSGTRSTFSPAEADRPAEAATFEVKAAGKPAEDMRMKARACAFRSVGATP